MKSEIKIGLVVTLSIAILIWGISYLRGNNLFSSDNYFYAKFNDIQGINVSAPIMMNGYKIGYVRKITFQENGGNLMLELSVLAKYSIPKGTKAVIFSTDIMGTKAIKFELGKSSEYLIDGDTLTSGIEMDMISQFMPLKDQVSELLLTIDTVLNDVHNLLDTNAQADIKTTLRNLKETSASMNGLMSSEKQRLKSIFTNIDSITSMFKHNSKNLNKAMANFSNISDSIAKSNLKSTIENANKTLSKTAQIMEQINSGEGTLGALLHNDSLYTNLKNSTESLNLLLIDMKAHPKRYVHFSLVGGKEKEKK